MTTTNFMIGPIKEGLRKDIKPYATPEDSFDTLVNALQFRGRIVRRPGVKTLGQLANGTPVMGLPTKEGFGIDVQTLLAFDTTDVYQYNGSAFVSLPSIMTTVWSGTDSQFFFSTNYANAFWTTNSKPGLHGKAIFKITNAAKPLAQVTTTSPHGFSDGQTVVFINVGGMTQINGLSSVITVTGANTFTLNDIDTSAFGVYTANGFALNSQISVAGQDGIRYYGILSNGTGWANYNPPVDTNNALIGALMIFPYRGYLVFLNTTESNGTIQGTFNYGNRARWTQQGTPYYSVPAPVLPNVIDIDVKAARSDLFGRGGADDAETNEVIVGAGFVRDILVVFFERSTWRLRYVNNAQKPFDWERVNYELGSSCTFSSIIFDKGLMTIGDRGIVISDANDTLRFDEKIPDQLFEIRQSNFGFQRVQGIRTFRTKLIFWAFPSLQSNIYPDQILVFNYDTKNWSLFDDSFTCFGYYYQSTPGYTWAYLTDPWSAYDWLTWAAGPTQSQYEDVVAGNQQGYVFQLEQTNSTNDPSLTISNILAGVVTSSNHNLKNGDWISLSGVTGTTSDDGVSLNGRNFQVGNPSNDANTFNLQEFKEIPGGAAIGTTYTYQIEYTTIFPGSIQINIGALVFTDPALDGVLAEASSLGSGTIDYTTGMIALTFNPSIGSTQVYIRCVTLDPLQGVEEVNTTGAYGGGGQITVISNFNIVTKIFNFFNDDKRARLSKIDFYVDTTTNGQFICNVLGDSDDVVINTPLADNLLSNVVLTSANPYQIGTKQETIFRLFCDAIAQTIQLQFTMSPQQMAVTAINSSDVEIVALMISMRRGGRLP